MADLDARTFSKIRLAGWVSCLMLGSKNPRLQAITSVELGTEVSFDLQVLKKRDTPVVSAYIGVICGLFSLPESAKPELS